MAFSPELILDVPDSAARWRRVVTGTRDHHSVVHVDQPACPFQMGVKGGNGIAVTELWRTERDPVCAADAPDRCGLPFSFGPPAGGTVAQIVEWPPDTTLLGVADPAIAKAATMHRTPTIDYIFVISGEIWLMMEEGEVKLSAGDSLVQRGTSHAWSNRTDQPCRIFLVMVEARE